MHMLMPCCCSYREATAKSGEGAAGGERERKIPARGSESPGEPAEETAGRAGPV